MSEDVLTIIGAIFFGVPLILGVIGIIVERIRTGHWWEGQGFGKK